VKLWLAAVATLGCGAPPATDAVQDAAACVTYHFTRVLAGTGLDASVAPDGTIVAVSEVDGLHQASVLNGSGNLLGSFELDPFTAVVRAAAGGAVVAAASDGRVRRYAATGEVVWTSQLEHRASDLVALAEGGAIVAGQAEAGVVSYLDYHGRVTASLTTRTAPTLAADESGRLALISRDQCRPQAPCGAGFDPNRPDVSPAPLAGGSETSAMVLLDQQGQTTGGFISSVTSEQPVGPLFVRAGLMQDGAVVIHSSAVASERLRTNMDVDPGAGVALREVDTDAAPDRLLAFEGRTLLWDHGFEPLDDSGRAYVIAMSANQHGVVVDVNGDVYKTHHIVLLGPDGKTRLRYDQPNDGIENDVRLAGMDGAGRIVLSGRFAGSHDFDPGPDQDTHTASVTARRYISVLSECR
jgi:hypothetical protein